MSQHMSFFFLRNSVCRARIVFSVFLGKTLYIKVLYIIMFTKDVFVAPEYDRVFYLSDYSSIPADNRKAEKQLLRSYF